MFVHLVPLARRLCLAGTLLGFACSGGGDASSPDAGPPTLELGTGQRSFEALANGDMIQIVQGPQDGYHFFGSLRATNLNAGDSEDLASPDNPTTTFEVYVGTDRIDAMAAIYTQGLEADGGSSLMLGRTVILDIEDDSELDGISVRFLVRVQDVDGIMLSDERTLVAIPHPNTQ